METWLALQKCVSVCMARLKNWWLVFVLHVCVHTSKTLLFCMWVSVSSICLLSSQTGQFLALPFMALVIQNGFRNIMIFLNG